MSSLSDVRVKRRISCQYNINVWLSMKSGYDTNPIFFGKIIKIGRPEHSLTLHPLRPITSNFCLTPLPPTLPQSGRHICITPYVTTFMDFCFFCIKGTLLLQIGKSKYSQIKLVDSLIDLKQLVYTFCSTNPINLLILPFFCANVYFL